MCEDDGDLISSLRFPDENHNPQIDDVKQQTSQRRHDQRAVDSIAQTFDGFYFGRFDVRYADPERFKAGGDLTVIELNGVTSESTNVYDPAHSMLWAYRTLFKQWSLLFQIAAANRCHGAKASSWNEVISEVVSFYHGSPPSFLSD